MFVGLDMLFDQSVPTLQRRRKLTLLTGLRFLLLLSRIGALLLSRIGALLLLSRIGALLARVGALLGSVTLLKGSNDFAKTLGHCMNILPLLVLCDSAQPAIGGPCIILLASGAFEVNRSCHNRVILSQETFFVIFLKLSLY